MSNKFELAIQEASSIDEYSFDLPESLNNIETFLFFDAQVNIAFEDLQDARVRLAYYLYMIFKHELHLHSKKEATETVLVENGAGEVSTHIYQITEARNQLNMPIKVSADRNFVRPIKIIDGQEITVTYSYFEFPSRQSYLEVVSSRLGNGVSTMFRDFKAIGMALNNPEMGIAKPSDLSKIGMPVLAKVYQAFQTDQSGKIIGVKAGAVPDDQQPEEYAAYVIQELTEKQELSGSDYYREETRLLRPGRPSIWFGYDSETSLQRKWYYERTRRENYEFYSGDVDIDVDDDGVVLYLRPDQDNGHLPDEIVDKVFKALGL